MSAWWERFPGRLEYELELLEADGWSPALDCNTRDTLGVIRLGLTGELPGIGQLELVASFPDAYPYVRPDVAAPGIVLAHHQHPFSRGLCLLGRSTRFWGSDDTLAGLLRSQLSTALEAGARQAASESELQQLDEERQAEPFSDYYTYAPAAMVLVDGAWVVPPEAACGEMVLGVPNSPGPWPPSDDPQELSQAAVIEILDETGTIVANASDSLASRYPNPLRGRWSRLAEPVASDDPEAIWEAASDADTGGEPELLRGTSSPPSPIQVRGVMFPEEVSWRKAGVGWLFVVHRTGRTTSYKGSKKRRMSPGTRTSPGKSWLVRAGYAGPSDLTARIPELGGLAKRYAIVAGVGAIGGTIADQLARAGIGRLLAIDTDVLHPGNTVRHASPFSMAGLPKAAATSRVAVQRSPYVVSRWGNLRIGAIRTDPRAINEIQVLEDELATADILIDATAELGLQHLLSDLARRHGTTYLCASATNGAWGGLIALIDPDCRPPA